MSIKDDFLARAASIKKSWFDLQVEALKADMSPVEKVAVIEAITEGVLASRNPVPDIQETLAAIDTIASAIQKETGPSVVVETPHSIRLSQRKPK